MADPRPSSALMRPPLELLRELEARPRARQSQEFDPVAATLAENRRSASSQPLPLPPIPPAVVPPPPAGDRAGAGALPAETVAAIYPGIRDRLPENNPWVAAATRIAEKYDLPRDVFLSLVQRESNFDPAATSRRGAVGLTQLMPGTARDLGVDPRDPEANLDAGARYLRQQLNRFGSLPLALAAYNAGPQRVIDAGREVPRIKETVHYVDRILRNAGMEGYQHPGYDPEKGYAEGGLASLDEKYAEGGRARSPAAAPVATPFDADYIERLAAQAVGAGEPVTEVRSSEGRGFVPMARSFGEAGQRMSAVLRGDVEPTPEEERQINVVRGFAEGPASIRAYHGSPYRFDKFDISKIGTGEGAQAYGHGLYFAGAEPVARRYRDDLARLSPEYTIPSQRLKIDGKNYYDEINLMFPEMSETPKQVAIGAIERNRGNIEEAYRQLMERDSPISKTTAQIVGALRNKKIQYEPPFEGHMYEVRLRTAPEELVNWNAPLVRQPERAIPLLEDVLRAPRTGSARILEREMKPIGEAIDLRTPEIAAQLREAGIPGLQYFDAASRTGRQNTRNYVMFGDDLIDITRRYAEGGLAALDQKYADGGTVRAPKETYISGQEHKLAYITDREAALLKARGGSGRMTEHGVRAYDEGDGPGGGDSDSSNSNSEAGTQDAAGGNAGQGAGPTGAGAGSTGEAGPGPTGPEGGVGPSGMSNADPEGTAAAANAQTASQAQQAGVRGADTEGFAPSGFSPSMGLGEAIGAFSRGDIGLAEAIGLGLQSALAPPGVTVGVNVDETGNRAPAVSIDPLGVGLGLAGLATGVPGLGMIGGMIGSQISNAVGMAPSVVGYSPGYGGEPTESPGGSDQYTEYGQGAYRLPTPMAAPVLATPAIVDWDQMQREANAMNMTLSDYLAHKWRNSANMSHGGLAKLHQKYAEGGSVGYQIEQYDPAVIDAIANQVLGGTHV